VGEISKAPEAPSFPSPLSALTVVGVGDQVRLAGMFGIKTGMFDFRADPLIVGFLHRSHSAGKVGCQPQIISGRGVHQVEQPPALGAEFEVVNRPQCVAEG
jgi:hypothetical protein